MCKSSLHSFLVSVPKCEHHLHLEGCLTPEQVISLAAKNNVTLPSDPAFVSAEALLERYSRFTSLDDFLHYYFLGMSVLQTESDFEELAYGYFQRAKKDGVVHAEVFFDPDAHTSRGVPYETVVKGFTTARERAQKEFGISSLLIICILRHLPISSAQSTYEAALQAGHFTNGTLGGIGISGSEIGKDALGPKAFASVFVAAKEAGIRRTAHSGEEGPPSYIEAALDVLQAERIDHGRTLVDDPALMARIAAQETLVTLCPISNVCLKGVPSISDLPIKKFLDAKVRFSINSDDPAYFGGYILDNYCAVQEAFNLSLGQWEDIVDASIEGSWCDSQRKIQLKNLAYKHSHAFRAARSSPPPGQRLFR